MRDGINLFRSPSQVLAAPPNATEVFRIGGLVEVGSLVEGRGAEISFRVTDGAATVPVVYTGIRPDLFGEGQGRAPHRPCDHVHVCFSPSIVAGDASAGRDGRLVPAGPTRAVSGRYARGAAPGAAASSSGASGAHMPVET
jgi:hypothetical protein